ncbi:hypothetical protein Q0590_21025 [Rhodocytophaga aerolata]|uniref:DUF3826 domain-containing protein n=1 Tax=Rhodocytophaga aerolata TaxID=455078 RepID=A0ABT8R9J6_9BACT|nr:hypothetical protein [Rhodocytophaga aerolata]MDO1448773.1 hypothetical protein [Rhodocytophaga aerolata]
MKFFTLVLVLILHITAFPGYSQEITPAAILGEKYKAGLFPEKFEYLQQIATYKQALKEKSTNMRKLDSLALLETFSMWPEEEQQKFKQIISLAKNDLSEDTYDYIKELGSDYAFTLNKVLNLNELYQLERIIIKSNKEIKDVEEWAANIAKVVTYFYDDFIADKLEEDMFYYQTVLYVEDKLQTVSKKYHQDIGLFLLANEEEARSLYYTWKKWKPAMKPSPARELLFLQLEKRFTKTFTD